MRSPLLSASAKVAWLTLYALAVVWLTWPLAARLGSHIPAVKAACEFDTPLDTWALAHQTRALTSDLASFPVLAAAVADNQRLWGALAEDLMSDANRLPAPLRAQLISLAEFVRRHSLAVLGGRAKLSALIDINTAIMKGLRGNLEAAA